MRSTIITNKEETKDQVRFKPGGATGFFLSAKMKSSHFSLLENGSKVRWKQWRNLSNRFTTLIGTVLL